MSKYLKSGLSRYLKAQSAEHQRMFVSSLGQNDSNSHPDLMEARVASGYTALDTKLFDKLIQAVPTTPVPPPTARTKGTHKVTYTKQDAELFDQLSPSEATHGAGAKVVG